MSINNKSAKFYVLKALIPYSKSNLALSFRPQQFFADIEKTDRLSRASTRNAFYRAIEKGLIEMDSQNLPRLTEKGHRAIAPYTAKKLKGAQLVIAFDIPESSKWRRNHLRAVLREFSFKPIQKSVWGTNLDCIEYIRADLKNLNLSHEVKFFEAREIN